MPNGKQLVKIYLDWNINVCFFKIKQLVELFCFIISTGVTKKGAACRVLFGLIYQFIYCIRRVTSRARFGIKYWLVILLKRNKLVERAPRFLVVTKNIGSLGGSWSNKIWRRVFYREFRDLDFLFVIPNEHHFWQKSNHKTSVAKVVIFFLFNLMASI